MTELWRLKLGVCVVGFLYTAHSRDVERLSWELGQIAKVSIYLKNNLYYQIFRSWYSKNVGTYATNIRKHCAKDAGEVAVFANLGVRALSKQASDRVAAFAHVLVVGADRVRRRHRLVAATVGLERLARIHLVTGPRLCIAASTRLSCCRCIGDVTSTVAMDAKLALTLIVRTKLSSSTFQSKRFCILFAAVAICSLSSLFSAAKTIRLWHQTVTGVSFLLQHCCADARH